MRISHFVAHLHPLFAGVLFLFVLVVVRLDRSFEMPLMFGVLVFTMQGIVAVSAYYGLALMNNRVASMRIQRRAKWYLLYFLFICRVWILSAFEAECVVLILFPKPMSVMSIDYWILGAFLFFVAINVAIQHVLV